MYGPNPEVKYPLEGFERTIFLKHFITRKNVIIGDYSYYDDPQDPEKFEDENVLYHWPTSKEKLIIGKFVAIAMKVKFIMSSANHKLDGFSSFPFAIFGSGWEKEMDITKLHNKGDTIVGNDVWLGYDSTILPGIKIGDGVIIAAKAVVAKDVPPYSIVAGNPAKVVKMRFDDSTIEELLKIKWWGWSKEKITRNIKYIIDQDLKNLKNAN